MNIIGNAHNLLELDVEKLFEDNPVKDIIEVEKMLDIEIEKKRAELRGMVGDRYRDVLTASIAIKYMKNISETIVKDIEDIIQKCESLVAGACEEFKKSTKDIDPVTINKRVIIMELRLLMVINNQIWMRLEGSEILKAAELFLLSQHIHTGLQLLDKNTLKNLPILQRIKYGTDTLRTRILKKAKENLQAVDLTSENTSSNLNAMILLEQYRNDTDLLKVFIGLRKDALTIVIKEPHATVRIQITTMIKCLITTVLLLQECFVNFQNTKQGLIWHKLESIIGHNAPHTLTSVVLPSTPLSVLIPDIIQEFRPKYDSMTFSDLIKKMPTIVESWLNESLDSIHNNVKKSLELVTTIKGLHFIREEALKIEMPSNWSNICNDTTLPSNFQIWFYFFQKLITNRAKELITNKINTISTNLEDNLTKILNGAIIKNDINEYDLRWYSWKEEDCDISRTENKHIGLSMKSKGFSPNIIKLCSYYDEMYSDLWQDIRLYLYGVENSNTKNLKEECSNKFVDRSEVEDHLHTECYNSALRLTKYVVDDSGNENVIRSLVCARFLHAVCELCPSFKLCCLCEGRSSEWEKICSHFHKNSLHFWNNWVLHCIRKSEDAISMLGKSSAVELLHILPKWNTVEIQEQTDDNVFKSLIKVPSHPSILLQNILIEIGNHLSAVVTHTLPKEVHLNFLDRHIDAILEQYVILANSELNQTQALQFLFDVKCVSMLLVQRENLQLVTKSHNICDKFRAVVDPFDLDVLYSYLQNNVKVFVVQSQVILGSFLPSSGQLANIGILEKNKDLEKDPSVLAVCVPSTTSWFPLLPVTVPVQKVAQTTITTQKTSKAANAKPTQTKKTNTGTTVRSGAAAFFGAMTNDWFS